MKNKEKAQDLEGFSEIEARLFQQLLREMLPQVSADEVAELLTPEQRHGVLAHIAVEELAKTLTPDQRFGVLLAMSDDILRQLPNTLIDSLPESVRAEIQRRLAH